MIPKELQKEYEEYEKEKYEENINENIKIYKTILYNTLTLGETILTKYYQKTFFNKKENKYEHFSDDFYFDNEIIKKNTFANLDFNKISYCTYTNYNKFCKFVNEKCDLDKDYKYEILLHQKEDIDLNDIITIKIIAKIKNGYLDNEFSININDYKFCDYKKINKNSANITIYKLGIGSKKYFQE
jgi:hypothetical protein